MVALYALARGFSEPQESVPSAPQPEAPLPSPDDLPEESAVFPRALKDAVIQNYGFDKIDLRTGPQDPTDFFDELLVSFFFRDRGGVTGYSTNATYTVCTPKGIASKMQAEGWVSLVADGYIVVERYDMTVVLDTILDLVTDGPPPEPAPETQAPSTA